MSEIKNDMMPMGMPPVMVDYEDFAQFMAQEERLKELEAKLTEAEARERRLREVAQEFVDRCDKGEVRSKYTYRRFKQALQDIPEEQS